MLDLIARLEAATQSEMDLDAQIGALVRWHPYGPDHWMRDSDIEFRATGYYVQAFRDTGESCASWKPLAYTSSIDAALTLVPDCHVINIGTDVGMWAYIWRDTEDYDGVPFEARSQFLAIALCIAALKARAALGNNLPESGKDFPESAAVASNVRGGQE